MEEKNVAYEEKVIGGGQYGVLLLIIGISDARRPASR